jgi:hypothetical protein
MHLVEGLTILCHVDTTTRTGGAIPLKSFAHSHTVGLIDAMDVIEIEFT